MLLNLKTVLCLQILLVNVIVFDKSILCKDREYSLFFIHWTYNVYLITYKFSFCTFAKKKSVNNKLFLSIAYEILWFALAAIASYLLIVPARHAISDQFAIYLMWSLFLVFTYFRFTAFMMHSVLLESIWVKVLLFILNVPLFFFVLNQYYTFGRVYDEYNFTAPATVLQHIKSGTELDDLMYIKKLVTFSGVAAMVLIVLLEARIVKAIFKLRQLDKLLYKK